MNTTAPPSRGLDRVPEDITDPAWGQSLSNGALGPALFHLTRATTAPDSADTALAWLRAATRTSVSSHPDGALFCGVTSLAYVLAITRAGDAELRRRLHTHVLTLTRKRLHTAHRRLADDATTTPREYDLIGGLSGLGAYLLTTQPDGDTTRAVLSYLVALTEPRHVHGRQVPGWWTRLSPKGQESPGFVHGHANLGMAHGIAGPLAVLATALHHGVEVPGQVDAIEYIAAWMNIWRHRDDDGVWWPRWITWPQYLEQQPVEPNPMRPTWCYGIPGQARAQHLAALALGRTGRAAESVDALAACATDQDRLAALDASLCHGRSGLLQTLRRTAEDEGTGRLDKVVRNLEHQVTVRPSTGTGLLEGSSGQALAHLPAPAHRTRWDTCLLITS
ncbi:lanthionine synthetase C family protein [Nocardiopsis quinghaiensis]|uniref:lanthionine synthetase C family protein n=1 Tax=Nocardiopsis quinghaiensis TaxID=464995 RepID=UPI0016805A1C|nr:lanthionine synthetase C family protein [Nocardiopsis quinghaiensis]